MEHVIIGTSGIVRPSSKFYSTYGSTDCDTDINIKKVLIDILFL